MEVNALLGEVFYDIRSRKESSKNQQFLGLEIRQILKISILDVDAYSQETCTPNPM